jgi:hypothetical protein
LVEVLLEKHCRSLGLYPAGEVRAEPSPNAQQIL